MRYPVKIRLELIDAILPVLGKDESILVLASGREIELEESTTKVEARIDEAREAAERHEQGISELEHSLRHVEVYRKRYPKHSRLFGRSRRTG